MNDETLTDTPAPSVPAAPARKPRLDLTSGPVARTLIIFALPVLGSNILQSLNATVNSIWVGRYLGEAALTATSNANIVLFFLLGTVFGIGMASTILVGQAIGAKNLDQAKRVIGTSATFFTAVAVLASVSGYWFTPHILDALRTPAEARPYAVAYLRIIFIAVPFMFCFTFLMVILRGAGDSKTPFLFMALSVALDVGLNPLFIFGAGPLHGMGIGGAATATLIAQVVSLAAMFVYLYRKKHFLRLQHGEFHYLKPDLTILRALLLKGLPMGMQMVVMTSSLVVMMGMVNGYGTQTTAAYGVATQIWNYVQMPAFALGAGVSAMAAQNVGAKRWDRISRITWSGVAMNLFLTGIPALLIIAFSKPVLSIFLPAKGGASVAIGQHINGIAIWSFVLFGVTMVVFGVVRATGAVMAPLCILFISLWAIRIPFAKILTPQYGADAIWWSFPLGSFIACLLALAYYFHGSWRKAHMMVESAPKT